MIEIKALLITFFRQYNVAIHRVDLEIPFVPLGAFLSYFLIKCTAGDDVYYCILGAHNDIDL